jgi:uncharacterized protein YpmS
MENKKRKFKLENPWKLAFFVLIGILAGVICFVAFRVTRVSEADNLTGQSDIVNEDPTFQIQLNKSQTNQLINFYLDEFQKDSGVEYSFSLENQALFTGTFEILGHKLKFYLYFEPYVTDSGEIELKAKSLSVGTLSLPISELMNYVKNNFKLPSWVEINSSDELIILHLNQFKYKNGISFNAEQIDLVDDVIVINVYLPNS